mgnify:CR=1 FL=1
MKKFIQLILSFVVAFIFLGCSSEVTVQYESANFTKITYTYDKKTDVITKFKIENRTEVPDEEEAEKVKQFFKELELLDGIKTTSSGKYLIVDTSLEIDLKVLKYSDMKKSFVPAIRNLWNDKYGPIRAYSFMLYVLLVVPCAVAMGALKQEFGWKLLAFQVSMLLILPYAVSVLFFNVARLFI